MALSLSRYLRPIEYAGIDPSLPRSVPPSILTEVNKEVKKAKAEARPKKRGTYLTFTAKEKARVATYGSIPSTLSHSRQLPHGNDTLVFDFPKPNMPGLCSFLENSDFSHCFLSCDVDHVWSSIKLIIQQAMDLFLPKVKLCSHQFPKWFTPDIRHRLNCLRTLRRKYRTHPTVHNLSKLLLLESNLDGDISSAKSRYETDLILDFANSNCNKIFKYIRGISGHSSIPPSVKLCSAFATSDLDKASLFNKYFYSIFTPSSFDLPPLNSLPTLSSTLSDISISTFDVFKSLVSLDPTKAMGIDCLGPQILKECGHILFSLFIISFASAFLLIPFLRNGESTELPPYINLVIVLWCLTTDPFLYSVPSPKL